MELATHVVSAGGLVENGAGEILLVKNPRRGWEFPGGIVERGESVIQALEREILEECGVCAEVGAAVGVYSSVSSQPGYGQVQTIPPIVTLDFLCRYVSGELKTGPETLDIQWFSRERAARAVEDPLYAARLAHMLSGGAFRCCAFRRSPFQIEEDVYLELPAR